MSEETLGQYIRRMRKQRGLTQEDLARLVGITKAYICIIERGEVTGRDVSVSPQKLALIAKSLCVPAEEVFNRAGILPEGTLLVRNADEEPVNGAAAPHHASSLDLEHDWRELQAVGYGDLPPLVRDEIRHYVAFRAHQEKQRRRSK